MAKWEELLQPEIREKQAGWSKGDEMGRPTPTGRQREASVLEQKWRNGKNYSNRKSERSKRVGAKVAKQADLLQPEDREKQAGWGKGGETGRAAPTGRQREASVLEQRWRNGKKYSNRKISRSKRVGARVAKQADLLQPEDREKQACWSKGGETGRSAPTGRQREASVLEQRWRNR